MSQPFNWKAAIQEWLNNNPKKIAPEMAELRTEFIRRFPPGRLGEMTLEEYALGHETSKDSFCYWLEWETKQLGSVSGGSAAKWGVWWMAKENDWVFNKAFPYSNPQAVLNHIKAGLVALVTAVENEQFEQLDNIGDQQLGQNRNSLRAKPLFLYFPEEFLPISNPTHLVNILTYFGLKSVDGLHTRNRQLLAYLKEQPEFSGFDTQQMMQFLYAYELHEKKVLFGNEKALD